MNPGDAKAKHHDGRDEMNLADFPISALQRQQPSDADGRKRDRLEFEATRYDPVSRQRVLQRVTLTSSARDGLPTPADEHVILALLYVAKHSHNFADATVYFAPSQMFDVMGWAPNGRSYTRLRDVLRRLKSLTIRYENAWWDAAGRGYEEEVATGVISAYKIARQVSGPRTAHTAPLSWARWTQLFHQRLLNGNIKRLDLDLFFRLKTPTAQRMFRFLDKRFYNTDSVSMDLIEFACGHVGLTESDNVAILKRRLAPAIAELEEVGFLVRLDPAERYQKVKAGVWRVQFRRAAGPTEGGRMKDEPKQSVDSRFILHPSSAAFSAGDGILPALGSDHAGDAGAARPGTGRSAGARTRAGDREGVDRVPGAGDEEALAGLPFAERGGAKVSAGGGTAAPVGAAARGVARGGRGGAPQGPGSAAGSGTGGAAVTGGVERPVDGGARGGAARCGGEAGRRDGAGGVHPAVVPGGVGGSRWEMRFPGDPTVVRCRKGGSHD